MGAEAPQPLLLSLWIGRRLRGIRLVAVADPTRGVEEKHRGRGGLALLVLLTSLILSAPSNAHLGQTHSLDSRAGSAVKLRDCWLTVAYVPRPAEVLRSAFQNPPDLSETFYGPDPLLGVWALSCQHARVTGKSVGRVVMSLVAVPIGVIRAGDPPLANFLSHALIRIDSSSDQLTTVLRRAGLPGRAARGARYRHSPGGVLPAVGDLAIPGVYGLRVSASDADPTNPHDHRNDFEYRARRGRLLRLGISTNDAFDRFCFPEGGECSATVRATRGTGFSRLLGGTSVPARVGFDHRKIDRINLSLPAH